MYKWGDTISIQRDDGSATVTSRQGSIVELKITDDVTIQVSRTYTEGIGFYLGVYVTKSDGLSSTTKGLIGMQPHP